MMPVTLVIAVTAHFDFAEKTVGLPVGAGSEEQRVGGRLEGGRAVPKSQTPQAIDNNRPVIAVKPSGTLAAQAIGIDLPVAEVADQKRAAETPEIARCQRHSPRRVERA